MICQTKIFFKLFHLLNIKKKRKDYYLLNTAASQTSYKFSGYSHLVAWNRKYDSPRKDRSKEELAQKVLQELNLNSVYGKLQNMPIMQLVTNSVCYTLNKSFKMLSKYWVHIFTHLIIFVGQSTYNLETVKAENLTQLEGRIKA